MKVTTIQHRGLGRITVIKICCFLICCAITNTLVKAQPGDLMDSLITKKQHYQLHEDIYFTVKLQQQKNNTSRSVPTISCSCNTSDFCYVVYVIPNPNYPNSNRKVFINHTESNDKPHCECKVTQAVFENKQVRYIPALHKKGSYLIEIKGHGFTMMSRLFEVTD